MNAVIVDADLCYPATSGKRLRTLQLMKRMAQRHRVSYLCRCDSVGAETVVASDYLGDHGIETILVEQPRPEKRGIFFYARLAANLLSPLPYSVTSHAGRQINDALRLCAARRQVDLWQFEWPAYAAAIQRLPDARTVIATHNVESLIWQRYYETEQNRLKKWYIKGQWRKFQAFEKRLYAAATRLVTCTQDDAGIVRNHFGVPHVDVVENGVDNSFFEGTVRQNPQSKEILFLGALDYRPNVDAANLLLEQIFPAVLVQEPTARLMLVGRNPPQAIANKAASLKNVEIHANVPDVRPFLARAGLMVVPLRIGGGSRLKILEALAAGLPVVSTAVGAEGLELNPGRDIDVVNQVEEMPRALIRAMRTPERMLAMAERGRLVARDLYDWDVLADKLDRIWENCLGTRARQPALSEA